MRITPVLIGIQKQHMGPYISTFPIEFLSDYAAFYYLEYKLSRNLLDMFDNLNNYNYNKIMN